VVCFVTNNSFVEQLAFDGMRKHLSEDFTRIYHLDLHGNVRQNPKLSGTTHNVFGIQVGVGITIAIRKREHDETTLYYHRVPEDWTAKAKLTFLAETEDVSGIDWQTLEPDNRHTWLTEGLEAEFDDFLPMGTKATKAAKAHNVEAIFKEFSNGVKTNRDAWVYNFKRDVLIDNVQHFVETYNSEVDRWKRSYTSTEARKVASVDDFVTYEDSKIKWSRDLKLDLKRENYAEFEQGKVRTSLYRPFCKQNLFLDRILNEEVYIMPLFFPVEKIKDENIVICVSGLASNKDFQCLVANVIPCLDLLEKTQCFPFYTYDEDGSNRRENITDWALGQFREAYGQHWTKWDVFYYCYALLHHPDYRERYAQNLKRDLPRLPLISGADQLATLGKELCDLHLNYETAERFELTRHEKSPFSWRVEKMKLNRDKTELTYNKSLTLTGIPPQCFDYVLGNRSALEWVIDQYRVKTDKRSGIVNDPNNPNDEEAIFRLVEQVVWVSLETVKRVQQIEKVELD
jgi:predicted helicase